MNLTNFGLTKAIIICFLIILEVCVAILSADIFAGNIMPKDSLVFIGESLQVQCQLKDSVTDVDPNDMYFEITSHKENLTWVVNRTLENCLNTSVTNNRSLCATIEVTEKFSKKTTLSCLADGREKPILHTTFIYAERPLQNVTNFSVIYNYNSQTDLSWSFGQTYLDPLKIITQVDWNPNAPPNEKGNKCTNQTSTSCIIPQLSGQDIIFARVNVTLKKPRTNQRPNATYLTALFPLMVTSVHQIVVNDYRKTLQPLNMRAVDVAMTCVTLTWDLSLYFTSCRCPVIYQLTVMIKSTMSVTNVHNGVRQNSQPNVTFCSLKPFTSYGLTMVVKGDEVNPWSDSAFIEVTTKEDRPLTGPPVTDTSYYAGDCVSQKRQVIAYWNDPLLSSLQGHLTHFEINVGQKNTSVRKGSNFFKADLDCDSNHTVLIYSATKMGTSMSPAKIVVPNMHDELPLLSDVTVRINGINETSMAEKSENVTVTWSPGQHGGQNVTLTFYMCQETNVPWTCFNDYTTKELNVLESEMVLTDIPSTISLFGYALSDGSGRKRGIQWISCVYYAELPPKKLTSLNVVGLEESLLISWVSTKCDKETKILILHYHLLLCIEKINYSSPLNYNCLKTTVSNTESTFTIRDLMGGRPYFVYIEAESPAGIGPRSDPVTGTPHGRVSDLGRESIVGIVMGVLAGLIGLSIVVICFVRVCKKSQKQVESFAGSKFITWNEDMPSLTSKESGIGLDSSCASSTKEETVLQPSIASEIKQHLIIPKAASNTGEAIDTEMSNVTIKTLMVEVPLSSTLEATEENKSHKAIISESQTPSSPNIMNAGPSSDNANLYVKITNTNFASASDPSNHVNVDEGYNSPGMEVGSPTFANNPPQTPDLLKQTNLSPISSNLLNMLQETKPPTSLSTGPPIEVYNVGRNLGKEFHDASASGPQSKDTFSKYSPQYDSEKNQLKIQKIRSGNKTFEESSSASKDSNGLSKNLKAQSADGHVQELHSQITSDYVACTIVDEMNFRTKEIMHKSDFVNEPSCYKLDTQPSSDNESLMLQQMAGQNNVQDSDGNYKSVEFMEDGGSFDSHGQSGKSEDGINSCDDGMVKNSIGHLVPRVGDYLRQTPLNAAPKNDDYLKQTPLIAAPKNDDYLGQTPLIAAPKNDDYLGQTALIAAPKNNDYLKQTALIAARKNDDYLKQTALIAAPKNDDYLKQTALIAAPENKDYLIQATSKADSASLNNDDYSKKRTLLSDNVIPRNNDYVSQAAFNGTKINGDYLSQATLNGTKINGDYLSQAAFNGTKINGDYLSQATFKDTKINGDYLSHAKLNDTKINCESLSQATLNGNVVARNDDYVTHPTLNGNVVARNDDYVTHPTLNGDVVARNDDYVTHPTLNGDVVARNDDYVTHPTLNGDVVARNDDYVTHPTLNGDVVAGNDDYVTHPTLNGDNVVPKNNDYVFNTYF